MYIYTYVCTWHVASQKQCMYTTTVHVLVHNGKLISRMKYSVDGRMKTFYGSSFKDYTACNYHKVIR